MVVASVVVLSGCAKAKAATVPDGPPLATPAPPPRALGPIEEIAAAPVTTATPDAPAGSTSRPPAAPPRPPARPEGKPDPVAAQPPPAAAPAPAEPPRELRAAPSTADAAAERKVRDVLARAAGDLKRIDYQRLSTEGQSQYNQSKRFSEQAEQAVKERNFPYAMTLADKAAQLAAELAARR